MSESSSELSWWSQYQAEVAAGNDRARELLIQRSVIRMEAMARRMLRDFPSVRRWEQTSDVVQNASIRLWNSLLSVELQDRKHFLALCTLQVRRELIDLARKLKGAEGLDANHASHRVAWNERVNADDSAGPNGRDVSDPTMRPDRLDSWRELHERIAALPDDDRLLCDLLYYQGMTQAEAAELLDVSERTVRRRWQAIRLELYELIKDQL